MKTTDDYKKVKQLEEVIRNLKQADKSSEKVHYSIALTLGTINC